MNNNKRIDVIEITLKEMRAEFKELKKQLAVFVKIAYYIAGILTLNLGKIIFPGGF